MADTKKTINNNTWSKATKTNVVNSKEHDVIKKTKSQPVEVEQAKKEIKPAKVEKQAEPKANRVIEKEIVNKQVEPKQITKSEEKLIAKINEKQLIKQKLKEEKLAKKQNKEAAKKIYKEQLEQERQNKIAKIEEEKRLAKDEKNAKEKAQAEEAKKAELAEKKRLETETKEKALADKLALAEAKKAAEIIENQKIAEAKKQELENMENNKTTKKTPSVKQQEVAEVKVFKVDSQAERQFIEVEPKLNFDKGVKGLKQKNKYQKQLTNKYSKQILSEGAIVTTTNCKPSVDEHIIELKDVRKSYITGDLETPILKGIDIKLDKGDFIVILGPSGSGKTTFLNVISGLDKATEGDVFILGSNLTLLKDSHLTKFRRKNVGFIFQQYNLLTNLTSKENAEVGQNLANKDKQGMSIEDIFETIGMKEQMNKYPHQMSGGQQQRVSIARALAKNPEILFADEPTGALDEEMGRKVLEILVKVNREQKTTIVVVTHNPNIAKIANTVIHIKNGLIDNLEKNKKPADPKTIEWS
nr:ABC transporter ATP-binding protein [Mesoplasma chauliocola]